MEIPEPIRERRRSLRVEESLPFTIGQRGYEIEARTVNIGYHGAMCELDRDIPMMTQLSIALTLPAAGPSGRPRRVSAKGVIVRKERDGIPGGKVRVAIFFSDIQPKDEAALREFIDRRLSTD